jgi:hypothetical protein
MIQMYMVMAMVMVFNATFNNMSVMSLRSVLLVEETGVKFATNACTVKHVKAEP